MFKPLDKDLQPSTAVHLAQLVAMLGPPPSELLEQSDAANDFFDEHCQFNPAAVHWHAC